MKKYIILLFIIINLTADAQEMSDQLKPYLEKIEQEKRIEQQQKLLEQEKAAQDVQNNLVKVPAIDSTKIYELVDKNISSNNAKNSKKIKKYTEETYENMYLDNLEKYKKIERSKPYIKDGIIFFSYGVGIPIVICSPKHVCDIQFESGENITNIQIGDATRWVINVKNSDAQSESHIFLKPIVSGINTNLIVSTEKRQYTFNLKSEKKRYFNKISFNYQGNEQKLSTIFTEIPEKSKYDYYIKGDKPSWRPTEIRTDGRKTFIKLSDKFSNSPDFPTVYSLDSDGSESQVNKRTYKNWVIVDVMLDQGELKTGVGIHQNKVIFTRKGTFGLISKLFSED